MKIALALEFPLAQSGGTEVLVAELIHGLAPHHELILVSPDDAAALKKSPVAAHIRQHIPWFGTPTAAHAQQLAAHLAATQPDLVHFHLGGQFDWKTRACWRSPLVHARRAGLRVLATNHYTYSRFQDWERRPFLIQLAGWPITWLAKQFVVAHLATEVAVSQQNLSLLQKYYPLVRQKFRCLYHSRLRDETPPPFNPAREKIILCTGTLAHRKGQQVLAEAFACVAGKFPSWRLVFIGRGGDDGTLEHIRQLAAQPALTDRIEIHDALASEGIDAWLRRAAIFCIPSLHEGLGLTLQEAQFHGCACVGTRCGGVEDLIQDGDNGLLVPAGQPAPLAHALEQLMRDPALREQFSRRAPQTVLEKNMTAPRMVAAYEKLYAEILAHSA